MSEYRIDKEVARVSLITAGGERLSGDVFVSAWHAGRNGPERPEDILNAPGAFFPLMTDEGVIILAKDAIAELEYEAAADPSDAGTLPIGVTVTLNMTLSSGKTLAGELYVEGPVRTPRVLDFMNRSAASGHRFIELHTGDRVHLINHRHIETIRTSD